MSEQGASKGNGSGHVQVTQQLSAMFDGELPAEECELLARRLTRDEALRTKWSRYALIGSCIRGDFVASSVSQGVIGSEQLARRVQAAVQKEGQAGAATRVRVPRRLVHGALGLAVAAGVATVTVLGLRVLQTGPSAATATVLADGSAAAAQVLPTVSSAGSGEPLSYSTPTPGSSAPGLPATELANYVVAHSEFSNPLIRRNLLSAFVTGSPPAVDDEGSPADRDDAAKAKPREPVAKAEVTDAR
ncbi:MAG: sigma-E factor negative regulatory protein [Steroidobacteraceae bacterium]